ncbi:MAG: MGMT family protein [Parafilimonas sp.]|nr:MGMT family protein [Parafilimonas sp.]
MAKAKPAPKQHLKDITKTHSFFEDVWDVARQIPKGRVTSYGAIANYLGTKMSARMVGWAMGASVYAKPKVPAHRVVNRVGLLSGKMHFGSADEMQKRLEKEKIKVEKDKVVEFEKLFWDPAEELLL